MPQPLNPFSVFLLGMADAEMLAGLEALCFSTPWSKEQYEAMLAPRTKKLPRVCPPHTEGRISPQTELLQTATPVFGLKNSTTGDLAAYVSMAVHHRIKEFEIYNIAVHPEFRRNGLAKHLLGSVLALAYACGINNGFLEVRKSNTAAIALYQHFGFVACGERKRYYSQPDEDALIMQCELEHFHAHQSFMP